MIHVDAALVISLARRQDRLEAFRARLPADWPLPLVEAFCGVDGHQEDRPTWWKATAGAWGCYRSHRAVVDWCLDKGVDRVLVLEDDATFAPDFSARVRDLEVPGDAQQVYFGGQHLAIPSRGPAGLVVGRNVNRTHAYALLGRQTLELVREHLEPDPKRWKAKHHVDHHYGILHSEKRIRCYAVQPWLCGQAAGPSDVGKGSPNERWWCR